MRHAENLSLIDDLGRLRGEIARLKAREAELRADLIARCGAGRFAGMAHEARIAMHERRVFDQTRLPAEVLENPRYRKASRAVVLAVAPLRALPAPARPLPDLFGLEPREEDFDLTEPF